MELRVLLLGCLLAATCVHATLQACSHYDNPNFDCGSPPLAPLGYTFAASPTGGPVCFGGAHSFGTFHVPNKQPITSFRLVFACGSGITCSGDNQAGRWGCSGEGALVNSSLLSTFITRNDEAGCQPDAQGFCKGVDMGAVVPAFDSTGHANDVGVSVVPELNRQYYMRQGFNRNSKFLDLNASNADFVVGGASFRVYASKAFWGNTAGSATSVSGCTCAYVYVKQKSGAGSGAGEGGGPASNSTKCGSRDLDCYNGTCITAPSSQFGDQSGFCLCNAGYMGVGCNVTVPEQCGATPVTGACSAVTNASVYGSFFHGRTMHWHLWPGQNIYLHRDNSDTWNLALNFSASPATFQGVFPPFIPTADGQSAVSGEVYCEDAGPNMIKVDFVVGNDRLRGVMVLPDYKPPVDPNSTTASGSSDSSDNNEFQVRLFTESAVGQCDRFRYGTPSQDWEWQYANRTLAVALTPACKQSTISDTCDGQNFRGTFVGRVVDYRGDVKSLKLSFAAGSNVVYVNHNGQHFVGRVFCEAISGSTDMRMAIRLPAPSEISQFTNLTALFTVRFTEGGGLQALVGDPSGSNCAPCEFDQAREDCEMWVMRRMSCYPHAARCQGEGTCTGVRGVVNASCSVAGSETAVGEGLVRYACSDVGMCANGDATCTGTPSCVTGIVDNCGCQHGGVCLAGATPVSCQCPPGYAGVFCETQMNMCERNNNGDRCPSILNNTFLFGSRFVISSNNDHEELEPRNGFRLRMGTILPSGRAQGTAVLVEGSDALPFSVQCRKIPFYQFYLSSTSSSEVTAEIVPPPPGASINCQLWSQDGGYVVNPYISYPSYSQSVSITVNNINTSSPYCSHMQCTAHVWSNNGASQSLQAYTGIFKPNTQCTWHQYRWTPPTHWELDVIFQGAPTAAASRLSNFPGRTFQSALYDSTVFWNGTSTGENHVMLLLDPNTSSCEYPVYNWSTQQIRPFPTYSYRMSSACPALPIPSACPVTLAGDFYGTVNQTREEYNGTEHVPVHRTRPIHIKIATGAQQAFVTTDNETFHTKITCDGERIDFHVIEPIPGIVARAIFRFTAAAGNEPAKLVVAMADIASCDAPTNFSSASFEIWHTQQVSGCAQLSLCANNGTCTDTNSQLACTCTPEWTGPYCNVRAPCTRTLANLTASCFGLNGTSFVGRLMDPMNLYQDGDDKDGIESFPYRVEFSNNWQSNGGLNGVVSLPSGSFAFHAFCSAAGINWNSQPFPIDFQWRGARPGTPDTRGFGTGNVSLGAMSLFSKGENNERGGTIFIGAPNNCTRPKHYWNNNTQSTGVTPASTIPMLIVSVCRPKPGTFYNNPAFLGVWNGRSTTDGLISLVITAPAGTHYAFTYTSLYPQPGQTAVYQGTLRFLAATDVSDLAQTGSATVPTRVEFLISSPPEAAGMLVNAVAQREFPNLQAGTTRIVFGNFPTQCTFPPNTALYHTTGERIEGASSMIQITKGTFGGTCWDREQNNGETGVDCGGVNCHPCPKTLTLAHDNFTCPNSVSSCPIGSEWLTFPFQPQTTDGFLCSNGTEVVMFWAQPIQADNNVVLTAKFRFPSGHTPHLLAVAGSAAGATHVSQLFSSAGETFMFFITDGNTTGPGIVRLAGMRQVQPNSTTTDADISGDVTLMPNTLYSLVVTFDFKSQIVARLVDSSGETLLSVTIRRASVTNFFGLMMTPKNFLSNTEMPNSRVCVDSFDLSGEENTNCPVITSSCSSQFYGKSFFGGEHIPGMHNEGGDGFGNFRLNFDPGTPGTPLVASLSSSDPTRPLPSYLASGHVVVTCAAGAGGWANMDFNAQQNRVHRGMLYMNSDSSVSAMRFTVVLNNDTGCTRPYFGNNGQLLPADSSRLFGFEEVCLEQPFPAGNCAAGMAGVYNGLSSEGDDDGVQSGPRPFKLEITSAFGFNFTQFPANEPPRSFTGQLYCDSAVTSAGRRLNFALATPTSFVGLIARALWKEGASDAAPGVVKVGMQSSWGCGYPATTFGYGHGANRSETWEMSKAGTPLVSCHDGQKNGDETGVDCGGNYCKPCLVESTAFRDLFNRADGLPGPHWQTTFEAGFCAAPDIGNNTGTCTRNAGTTQVFPTSCVSLCSTREDGRGVRKQSLQFTAAGNDVTIFTMQALEYRTNGNGTVTCANAAQSSVLQSVQVMRGYASNWGPSASSGGMDRLAVSVESVTMKVFDFNSVASFNWMCACGGEWQIGVARTVTPGCCALLDQRGGIFLLFSGSATSFSSTDSKPSCAEAWGPGANTTIDDTFSEADANDPMCGDALNSGGHTGTVDPESQHPTNFATMAATASVTEQAASAAVQVQKKRKAESRPPRHRFSTKDANGTAINPFAGLYGLSDCNPEGSYSSSKGQAWISHGGVYSYTRTIYNTTDCELPVLRVSEWGKVNAYDTNSNAAGTFYVGSSSLTSRQITPLHPWAVEVLNKSCSCGNNYWWQWKLYTPEITMGWGHSWHCCEGDIGNGLANLWNGHLNDETFFRRRTQNGGFEQYGPVPCNGNCHTAKLNISTAYRFYMPPCTSWPCKQDVVDPRALNSSFGNGCEQMEGSTQYRQLCMTVSPMPDYWEYYQYFQVQYTRNYEIYNDHECKKPLYAVREGGLVGFAGGISPYAGSQPTDAQLNAILNRYGTLAYERTAVQTVFKKVLVNDPGTIDLLNRYCGCGGSWQIGVPRIMGDNYNNCTEGCLLGLNASNVAIWGALQLNGNKLSTNKFDVNESVSFKSLVSDELENVYQSNNPDDQWRCRDQTSCAGSGGPFGNIANIDNHKLCSGKMALANYRGTVDAQVVHVSFSVTADGPTNQLAMASCWERAPDVALQGDPENPNVLLCGCWAPEWGGANAQGCIVICAKVAEINAASEQFRHHDGKEVSFTPSAFCQALPAGACVDHMTMMENGLSYNFSVEMVRGMSIAFSMAHNNGTVIARGKRSIGSIFKRFGVLMNTERASGNTQTCVDNFTITTESYPSTSTGCATQPCLNGGVCSDVAGGTSYTCACVNGYSGLLCGQAPCPAGTVLASDGTCTKCPAGKSWRQTAAGGGVCVPCDYGTYNGTAGAVSCTACPKGTYASSRGSTECTACPLGQYNNNEGSRFCTTCDAGSITLNVGSLSCSACASGTSNVIQASGSARQITSTCSDCPAGTFSAAGAPCASCPVGQYSASASSSSCTQCPAGKYQGLPGQTECRGCNSSAMTTSQGAASCRLCGVNEYRASATSCEPCPAETAAPAGSTLPSHCVAVVVAPSTPAAPVVSLITDVDARVTWTAPSFDGNAPLLVYRLTLFAQASTDPLHSFYTLHPTTTIASLAEKFKLSPSTAYTVQLTAYNKQYYRSESSSADFTTLASAPTIVSCVASGGTGDSVYSTGDKVTVTFSAATNAPASVSTKAGVDAQLSFTPASVGVDYSGEFTSATTLVITISSITTTAGSVPVVGLTLCAAATGNTITAVGGSAVAAGSATLTGNWGTGTTTDYKAFPDSSTPSAVAMVQENQTMTLKDSMVSFTAQQPLASTVTGAVVYTVAVLYPSGAATINGAAVYNFSATTQAELDQKLTAGVFAGLPNVNGPVLLSFRAQFVQGGNTNSQSRSTLVRILAVNSAPVIVGPSGFNVTENTPARLDSVSLFDADLVNVLYGSYHIDYITWTLITTTATFSAASGAPSSLYVQSRYAAFSGTLAQANSALSYIQVSSRYSTARAILYAGDTIGTNRSNGNGTGVVVKSVLTLNKVCVPAVPTIVSAVMANSLRRVDVVFSSPVYLGANISRPIQCSDLLNLTGNPLGSNAFCWTGKSPFTRLIIGLGGFNSLNPLSTDVTANSLYFKAGAVRKCAGDGLASNELAGGWAQVAPPSLPIAPVVSVSGPSTVLAQCDSVTYTAFAYVSAGLGTSNIAPTYLWTVPESLRGKGIDTSKAVLRVPSLLLEEQLGGASYRFCVVVTNYVGMPSESKCTEVVTTGSPQPSLEWIGQNALTISKNERAILGALVTAPKCFTTNRTVVFTWSVSPSYTGFASSSIPYFAVRGAALTAGTSYTFTLKACMAVSLTSCASQQAVVTVKRSPLIVSLNSGAGISASATSNLTLIARAWDPDTRSSQGLSYAWACETSSDGQACIDASSGAPLTLASAASVRVLAGSLSAGLYVFTVTVSAADGRTASALTLITVIPNLVPSVTIQVPKPKTRPNGRIYVLASVNTAPLLVHYPSLPPPDYDWSITSGTAPTAGVEWSNANNKRYLILNRNQEPDAFVPGSTVTGDVTVSFPGVDITAAVSAFSFYVYNEPSGGYVSVDPTEGVARSTMFTLDCPGWVDTDSDRDLQYAFFYVDPVSGERAMLSAYTEDPRFSTSAIPGAASLTTVGCFVRSSHGTVTTATTTVNVSAAPLQPISVITQDFSASVTVASETQDNQERISVVLRASAAVNQYSNQGQVALINTTAVNSIRVNLVLQLDVVVSAGNGGSDPRQVTGALLTINANVQTVNSEQLTLSTRVLSKSVALIGDLSGSDNEDALKKLFQVCLQLLKAAFTNQVETGQAMHRARHYSLMGVDAPYERPHDQSPEIRVLAAGDADSLAAVNGVYDVMRSAIATASASTLAVPLDTFTTSQSGLTLNMARQVSNEEQTVTSTDGSVVGNVVMYASNTAVAGSGAAFDVDWSVILANPNSYKNFGVPLPETNVESASATVYAHNVSTPSSPALLDWVDGQVNLTFTVQCSAQPCKYGCFKWDGSKWNPAGVVTAMSPSSTATVTGSNSVDVVCQPASSGTFGVFYYDANAQPTPVPTADPTSVGITLTFLNATIDTPSFRTTLISKLALAAVVPESRFEIENVIASAGGTKVIVLVKAGTSPNDPNANTVVSRINTALQETFSDLRTSFPSLQTQVAVATYETCCDGSTKPVGTCSSCDGGGGGSSSNAGAIAGGVVGGIAVLGVIAAIVFYIKYRKQQAINQKIAQEAFAHRKEHSSSRGVESSDMRMVPIQGQVVAGALYGEAAVPMGEVVVPSQQYSPAPPAYTEEERAGEVGEGPATGDGTYL